MAEQDDALLVPPLCEELAELQELMEREIPMTARMGMRVRSAGPEGLVIGMPLEENRNHHQTAFAGSLNALCTITGWGATFLQIRSMGLADQASIVARRSAIKYRRPVDSPLILARCHPVPTEIMGYFVEMLLDKRQAKLDLIVEVSGPDEPDVAFTGSYVVQLPEDD